MDSQTTPVIRQSGFIPTTRTHSRSQSHADQVLSLSQMLEQGPVSSPALPARRRPSSVAVSTLDLVDFMNVNTQKPVVEAAFSTSSQSQHIIRDVPGSTAHNGLTVVNDDFFSGSTNTQSSEIVDNLLEPSRQVDIIPIVEPLSPKFYDFGDFSDDSLPDYVLVQNNGSENQSRQAQDSSLTNSPKDIFNAQKQNTLKLKNMPSEDLTSTPIHTPRSSTPSALYNTTNEVSLSSSRWHEAQWREEEWNRTLSYAPRNLPLPEELSPEREILLEQIRDQFLNFDMKQDMLLKIFCFNWNMYGKPPPTARELEPHIPIGIFDMYVIGTEECEASIQKALLFNSKAKWTAVLRQILGSEYVEVASETMQAIHIIVFVRKELSIFVNNVETEKVPTGIGDFLGNKGAVCVSMDIGTTSLLLVNAHFQAGDSASSCGRRNDDFAKINSRLTLRAFDAQRRAQHYLKIDNTALVEAWKRRDIFKHLSATAKLSSLLHLLYPFRFKKDISHQYPSASQTSQTSQSTLLTNTQLHTSSGNTSDSTSGFVYHDKATRVEYSRRNSYSATSSTASTSILSESTGLGKDNMTSNNIVESVRFSRRGGFETKSHRGSRRGSRHGSRSTSRSRSRNLRPPGSIETCGTNYGSNRASTIEVLSMPSSHRRAVVPDSNTLSENDLFIPPSPSPIVFPSFEDAPNQDTMESEEKKLGWDLSANALLTDKKLGATADILGLFTHENAISTHALESRGGECSPGENQSRSVRSVSTSNPLHSLRETVGNDREQRLVEIEDNCQDQISSHSDLPEEHDVSDTDSTQYSDSPSQQPGVGFGLGEENPARKNTNVPNDVSRSNSSSHISSSFNSTSVSTSNSSWSAWASGAVHSAAVAAGATTTTPGMPPVYQLSKSQFMNPANSASARFDNIIWMGDLNYRVKTTRRTADLFLRKNMTAELFASDELVDQMVRGAVFQGYNEGEVRFPPTYKYDVYTDRFDSSEKQRVPSWTDRILFKQSGCMLLERYESIRAMRYSDHRPVVAHFLFKAKKGDIMPIHVQQQCDNNNNNCISQ